MEQLLAYMHKEHLDGMFISRPVNVKYVSHYTGEDSWLFITEQEKFFLTDPRYTEQVSYECPDYTILNWRDPMVPSKSTCVRGGKRLEQRRSAANIPPDR